MKKLLYVLTGLCLLAGVFTGCEKPEKESDNSNGGGGTATEKTGTIKGVVTGKETGNPLSGVTIEIQPTGKQTQTAEDGTYIFDNLKAGAYTLKAEKDGYDDYENAEIQLGVEQTLTLDIELAESTPCALEGKVTDKKTGSPLAGVTLELQPGDKQVQTAEDGTYRFDSLKVRKYTLRAQKDGYVDYIQEEIRLVADQATAMDIEMEEEFVEFQITDAEDKAVEVLECYGTECVFHLKNVGNIAGEWRIETETEADWLTEISPKSGTLSAGDAQTITVRRKLQEEDKETVITIKTDKEDLQLKIVGKGFVPEMVYVEGGEFEMGATAEQGSDAADDEKPVHQVVLDGFYIGKYEVTQAQWKAVMGTNPSNWKGDNLPVEQVSWDDAQEFCKKLSEMTGKTYRLPTEAEWEYAARGGQNPDGTKYAGSNTIGDVAWYSTNSSSKTHPVGTKNPNGLGLYDMTGNVWEWCSDRYGSNYYSSSSAVNPQGPSSGSRRVVRGGSWDNDARYCRVSYRGYDFPDYRSNVLGFRVVRSSK